MPANDPLVESYLEEWLHLPITSENICCHATKEHPLSGDKRCLICGTPWMTESKMISHWKSERHGRAISRLRSRRQQLLGPVLVKRLDDVRKLDQRAEQLGLPWKAQMKLLLHEYMMATFMGTLKLSYLDEAKGQD